MASLTAAVGPPQPPGPSARLSPQLGLPPPPSQLEASPRLAWPPQASLGARGLGLGSRLWGEASPCP